jgi:hypothetical protein
LLRSTRPCARRPRGRSARANPRARSAGAGLSRVSSHWGCRVRDAGFVVGAFFPSPTRAGRPARTPTARVGGRRARVRGELVEAGAVSRPVAVAAPCLRALALDVAFAFVLLLCVRARLHLRASRVVRLRRAATRARWERARERRWSPFVALAREPVLCSREGPALPACAGLREGEGELACRAGGATGLGLIACAHAACWTGRAH